MRLSFRHRVFVGLLALGTLPLTAALVLLALQIRTADPSVGALAAIDDIAESGRELVAVAGSTQIDRTVREALDVHIEALSNRVALARRAEVLSKVAATTAGIVALAVALAVVAVSIGLARRWSAYVSAPIEELTAWVRLIEMDEPLPEAGGVRGAAEFEELRQALRRMSAALDEIRQQEIEKERLEAFRETARRVAHEMRGPLTSMRLAIGQLAIMGAASDKGLVSLEVLRDETLRLERLAQEFSDFGRLPEGPESEVDIGELLDTVLRTTVPVTCPLRKEVESGLSVRGHYEPLRRTFQNLLHNAVEGSQNEGISIRAWRSDTDAGCMVRIEICDHGPGVPLELRSKIFEPYFTTKDLGTGLGLAIVKQTIAAHGGEVSVTDADSSGAKFTVALPENA